MPLYLHDHSNALRFKVLGDLEGSLVTELQNSWRTASSILRGRTLLVDLTQVTSVDQSGRELLGRMQAEGAQLIAGPKVGGITATGHSGERPAVAPVTGSNGRLLCRVRDILLLRALRTKAARVLGECTKSSGSSWIRGAE